MFIILVTLVSVLTQGVFAVNIPNDASTPDTTGFQVYGPNIYKIISNYSDPVVIVNYTIENTIKHPYVLKDGSGNYVNTFAFNHTTSGVISISQTEDGGYIMVVNTSTNITDSNQVPAGVPLSQSGVWKKGVVTYGELGVSIVFWVVDTTNASQYDTVVIDIAGDKVDLQKFTLYDTKDMTVPDDFHSIMRLQVLGINVTGDTVSVRNLFDTLKEGDYSPFDNSKLESVLMPHYVKSSFIPQYNEITNIKLVSENGTPLKVYDSYTTITINESTHNITIVTLLGEFESGNIYVPGKKTFYFAIHLKPVVNVSNRIQLSDSDYMYYVYLNNTNNVDLGPGYIIINNVAPASAFSQIKDSLSIVPNDYVNATVETNNYSVSIKIFYNASLPAGYKRTLVVKYKYTDPLTAKVDEILKYLTEINQTTHNNNDAIMNLALALANTSDEITNLKQMIVELKGLIENNTNNEPVNVEVNMTEVLNMLNDLKNGQAQISSDIAGLSDTISALSDNIQALSGNMQDVTSNLNDISSTLDTIVQLLSQNGGSGESAVSVTNVLQNSYVIYLNSYIGYLDSKISMIQAQIAQMNGTTINSNDIARLQDIENDLNNIVVQLVQNVDEYSTNEERMVATMAYLSQANAEITEANILLSKIELELMNSGAGTLQVVNDLKAQLDNIQGVLTQLSSKVDTLNTKISTNNAGSASATGSGSGTGNGTVSSQGGKVNPMLFLLGGALIVVVALLLIVKKKKEEGEEVEEEEGEWEEEEEEGEWEEEEEF